MTIRTGLILILVFASLCVAVLLREVLLVGFLSIMMAVILDFPITLLSRRMPRGVAVVLTLLMVGIVLGGISFIATKPISEQLTQLMNQLPEAARRAESWF